VKNKRIFVYASEGCSRSKKMKPIFEKLQNNSNVNFEIFWMEKEWTTVFSELEELQNWPTIRFYNNNVLYWEIIGMSTEEEILTKYNEV
jgi:hypothetical protein